MNGPRIVKAERIVGAEAGGVALVADETLSFWGEFDPLTGKVILPGHPFYDQNLRSKIIVMRGIKGSSGVEASLRLAAMLKNAPAAMINIDIDALAVLACVVSRIPLLKIREEDLKSFSTGDILKIHGDKGYIEIVHNNKLVLCMT
jgi:uncharacterized protein